MATIDIGKLTFTHKGDYAGGTAYVANDVVYYNGSAYIAKTSTTGNLPTSTAHWNTFAAGSGGIWNAGLSIGTAGQVVKVNSGASALEFGTVSSDFVKLSEANSSTQTGSVVIDDLDVATYSAFRIYWNSVPTTDDAYIYFRMRTGGASGADHTTAYYDTAEWGVTGSGSSSYSAHENNQQEWRPLNNAGNEEWEGHRMIIDFYPRKSGYAGRMGNFFTVLGMRMDSSNNFRAIFSTGVYNHSDLPNPTGLKFFPNTGDFKLYNYKIYGVK